MKENQRKCVKCGSSPAHDPTVKLNRFPQPNPVNKSRCERWTKFNDARRSTQFQAKLIREPKMLCDKHFKNTSECSESEHSNNPPVCGTEPDGLHNMDVVVINNDPNHSVILENCETTNEKVRCRDKMSTIIIDDLSKKSHPLKRIFEECAETNDSLNKSKCTWDTDLVETSQDFDDLYEEWFSKTSTYKKNYKCQLYELTKKLRTYSVHERNLIIFKIDAILIENPPGFDTLSYSNTYSNTPTRSSNETSKVKRNSRKKAPSSAENLHSSNSDKTFTSSHSKKKKLKKDLSQANQMSTQVEDSCTKDIQVMQSLSPPKNTNDMLFQPVIDTSSIADHPVKVTNSIPIQEIKVTSSVTNQPHNIMSSIPNQPVTVITSISNQAVTVTANIPNQPVTVTSVPNQSVTVTTSTPSSLVTVTTNIPNQSAKINGITTEPVAQAMSSLVPPHLPLYIKIPENKLASFTPSKFIVSSSYPKGKIVIMKSKSANYIPQSSQPPILITVPSLPNVTVPASSRCDMNPSKGLSSIAVNQASQVEQYHLTLDPEERTADDIVVAHEVILSASADSLSENI